MATPNRDTVIFDLGGVLIDWDPRYLYRKLFAGEGIHGIHFATPGASQAELVGLGLP
jgi:hypothetical protein